MKYGSIKYVIDEAIYNKKNRTFEQITILKFYINCISDHSDVCN